MRWIGPVDKPSMASVWIDPPALRELRRLPGNVRHRVRAAITSLATNPRPRKARQLEISAPSDVEAWRLRIGRWRVVYTIDQDDWVGVWAIRKRPPYRYEDLDELIDHAAK